MKQIETYASLSDYISSIKRNDHSLPNVAQVGEIGYDEYFIYDRIILTIDSNPALFTIAKNAGWNHLSNSAITISELGMVTIDMLIDAISNKTTLTSFDEFKYFTDINCIGNGLFSNCSSITSITIPSSVTIVGSDAFTGLAPNAIITYAGRKPKIVTDSDYGIIGKYHEYLTESKLFYANPNSLYFVNVSGDGFTFDFYPKEAKYITVSDLLDDVQYSGDLYIRFLFKENVIPEKFFSGVTTLYGVVINNNVEELGNFYFYNCGSLTSITIPDSVTSLGSNCFYGCSGLTNVTIGTGVTGLSYACFAGCLSLTSITIPNNVTSIGDRCFRVCTGLTNVTIGTGVTSLGGYCFSGCSSLTSITSNAINAPTISSTTFRGVKTKGILNYPAGSNYSTWMGTGNYYLGSYNWTSQEI